MVQLRMVRVRRLRVVCGLRVLRAVVVVRCLRGRGRLRLLWWLLLDNTRRRLRRSRL